jgi:hypothetical protein
MKLLLKLKKRVHRKVLNLNLNLINLRLKTLTKRRKRSNLKNNPRKKKLKRKLLPKQKGDLPLRKHNLRKI